MTDIFNLKGSKIGGAQTGSTFSDNGKNKYMSVDPTIGNTKTETPIQQPKLKDSGFKTFGSSFSNPIAQMNGNDTTKQSTDIMSLSKFGINNLRKDQITQSAKWDYQLGHTATGGGNSQGLLINNMSNESIKTFVDQMSDEDYNLYRKFRDNGLSASASLSLVQQKDSEVQTMKIQNDTLGELIYGGKIENELHKLGIQVPLQEPTEGEMKEYVDSLSEKDYELYRNLRDQGVSMKASKILVQNKGAFEEGRNEQTRRVHEAVKKYIFDNTDKFINKGLESYSNEENPALRTIGNFVYGGLDTANSLVKNAFNLTEKGNAQIQSKVGNLLGGWSTTPNFYDPTNRNAMSLILSTVSDGFSASFYTSAKGALSMLGLNAVGEVPIVKEILGGQDTLLGEFNKAVVENMPLIKQVYDGLDEEAKDDMLEMMTTAETIKIFELTTEGAVKGYKSVKYNPKVTNYRAELGSKWNLIKSSIKNAIEESAYQVRESKESGKKVDIADAFKNEFWKTFTSEDAQTKAMEQFATEELLNRIRDKQFTYAYKPEKTEQVTPENNALEGPAQENAEIGTDAPEATTTNAPETSLSTFQKGKNWIKEQVTEQLSGLSPEEQLAIQQNPYVPETFNKLIEASKEQGLSLEDSRISDGLYEDIGQQILATFEKQRQLLAEDGIYYQQLRNIPGTFDLKEGQQKILQLLEDKGIRFEGMEGDKAVLNFDKSEYITGSDTALITRAVSRILTELTGATTVNDYLNLRKAISQLAKFQATDGTTGQKLVRQFRHSMNEVAHEAIPGLKEIDGVTSKRIEKLEKAEEGWFYREPSRKGQLRLNFQSIVKNLIGDNRKIMRQELESLAPGITAKIEAIHMALKLIKKYTNSRKDLGGTAKELGMSTGVIGGGIVGGIPGAVIGFLIEKLAIEPGAKWLRKKVINKILKDGGEKMKERLNEIATKTAELEELNNRDKKFLEQVGELIQQESERILQEQATKPKKNEERVEVKPEALKKESKAEEKKELSEKYDIKEEQAEQVQEDIDSFIKEMTKDSKGESIRNDVNYEAFSMRALEGMYEDKGIPATEREKIGKAIERKLQNKEMEAPHKLEQYYANEVRKLAEEEQRIGKVGKNKLRDKEYIKKQRDTWEDKRDKLIRTIQKEFGLDANQAYDKFMELHDVKLDKEQSRSNIINEAIVEQEVLDRMKEQWSKEPQYIRDMSQSEKFERSIVLQGMNEGYDLKKGSYGDDLYKGKDKVGVVNYREGTMNVILKDINDLFESGIISTLPENATIRVEGEPEGFSAGEWRTESGIEYTGPKFQTENAYTKISKDKALQQVDPVSGLTAMELAEKYGYAIKDLKELGGIKTTEGSEVLGAYFDKAIYLAEQVVGTTPYHEIGHGEFEILKSLDPERADELLQEIKDTHGKELTDSEAEEILMEEFGKYATEGAFNEKIVGKGFIGKIKAFFKNALNFLKDIFKKKDKLKQFYNDVLRGKIHREREIDKEMREIVSSEIKYNEKSDSLAIRGSQYESLSTPTRGAQTNYVHINKGNASQYVNKLNEFKKSINPKMSAKQFLSTLQNIINKNEASTYALIDDNGYERVLRVADHNGDAFYANKRGEETMSIVVKTSEKKSKFRKKNGGNMHEYVYLPRNINVKTMKGIVDGVINIIEKGGFTGKGFHAEHLTGTPKYQTIIKIPEGKAPEINQSIIERVLTGKDPGVKTRGIGTNNMLSNIEVMSSGLSRIQGARPLEENLISQLAKTYNTDNRVRAENVIDLDKKEEKTGMAKANPEWVSSVLNSINSNVKEFIELGGGERITEEVNNDYKAIGEYVKEKYIDPIKSEFKQGIIDGIKKIEDKNAENPLDLGMELQWLETSRENLKDIDSLVDALFEYRIDNWTEYALRDLNGAQFNVENLDRAKRGRNDAIYNFKSKYFPSLVEGSSYDEFGNKLESEISKGIKEKYKSEIAPKQLQELLKNAYEFVQKQKADGIEQGVQKLTAIANMDIDKFRGIMQGSIAKNTEANPEFRGKLPAQSIALLPEDIYHGSFGDIQLVFGRDTVDPKANKENKLYGSDAYTVTMGDVRTSKEETNILSDRIHERIADDIKDKAYKDIEKEMGELYDQLFTQSEIDESELKTLRKSFDKDFKEIIESNGFKAGIEEITESYLNGGAFENAIRSLGNQIAIYFEESLVANLGYEIEYLDEYPAFQVIPEIFNYYIKGSIEDIISEERLLGGIGMNYSMVGTKSQNNIVNEIEDRYTDNGKPLNGKDKLTLIGDINEAMKEFAKSIDYVNGEFVEDISYDDETRLYDGIITAIVDNAPLFAEGFMDPVFIEDVIKPLMEWEDFKSGVKRQTTDYVNIGGKKEILTPESIIEAMKHVKPRYVLRDRGGRDVEDFGEITKSQKARINSIDEARNFNYSYGGAHEYRESLFEFTDRYKKARHEISEKLQDHIIEEQFNIEEPVLKAFRNLGESVSVGSDRLNKTIRYIKKNLDGKETENDRSGDMDMYYNEDSEKLDRNLRDYIIEEITDNLSREIEVGGDLEGKDYSSDEIHDIIEQEVAEYVYNKWDSWSPKEEERNLISIVEGGKNRGRKFVEAKPMRVIDMYNEVNHILVPEEQANEVRELVKGTPLEDKITTYSTNSEIGGNLKSKKSGEGKGRHETLKDLQKKYGNVFFSTTSGMVLPIGILLMMMNQED